MKAKEIKLLEQLSKLEGYFTDAFNEADVLQMIANIRNDFPILNATSIQKKIDQMSINLSETEVELQDVKNESAERFLQICAMEVDMKALEMTNEETLHDLLDADDRNPIAYNNFRQDEIIRMKVRNGMELAPEEKDLVIAKF